MTTRYIALVVIGGLCLTQAGCPGGQLGGTTSTSAGREASETGAEPPAPPAVVGQRKDAEVVYDMSYDQLKGGGSMYAGTVVSVTVYGIDTKGASPCEWGTIRFRVARTIAGPPHHELIIRFMWFGPDPLAVGGRQVQLGADWADTYSPWSARPNRGERLLLLLADERMARQFYSKAYGNLYHRWEVNPDDPLVDGFALAGRYLVAKDEATADNLFRQLCQSRFQNMREFARHAAFAYVGWNKGDAENYHFRKGYDGVRQSHLALLYLKHAAARLRPEERLHVTHAFVFWFENTLEGVTDELLTAFDDWYVKELSVRDDMRRPKRALESLEELVSKRGRMRTVGLFKKSGRAGLIERVKECTLAGDPDVEKLSKALLARLDPP